MKQNELKEMITMEKNHLERIYREERRYLRGSWDWQEGFVEGIKHMSKFVIELLEREEKIK